MKHLYIEVNEARPKEMGFTLVELLVALSLTAILIAGAYATVSTGLNADKRAERRFDRAQESRALSKNFTVDVEQVLIVPNDEDAQISGDSKSLNLMTQRQSTRQGGIYDQQLVEYVFDEEAMTLKRTSKWVFANDTTAASQSSIVQTPTSGQTASTSESNIDETTIGEIAAKFEYLVNGEWVEAIGETQDSQTSSNPTAVRLSYTRDGKLGGRQDHVVTAYIMVPPAAATTAGR